MGGTKQAGELQRRRWSALERAAACSQRSQHPTAKQTFTAPLPRAFMPEGKRCGSPRRRPSAGRSRTAQQSSSTRYSNLRAGASWQA